MLKLAIAIGLGAAAWYWRNEIQSMIETQFPGAREKTARTLEEGAQLAARAFEQTKARVGSA